MCKDYRGIWDSCHNSKQVMDMALGVKAVDFLCDSIAKGWGMSPEDICDRFRPFLNGRYISEQKGYTSKMYCKYTGIVDCDTTLLLLIDCDVTLAVPHRSINSVYCVGKCNIKVIGQGKVAFVCYGNPDDISITSETSKTKRINKQKRDANGD